MNVLFCWTGVTSYMADCWRALQAEPDVSLKVIVEKAESGKAFAAAQTLKGIDHVLADGPEGPEIFGNTVGWIPDVIFAGGWRSVTTRRVVARFGDVPKVFCLDMPWRWSVRCVLARFALRRFLRQFDAVCVPGASAASYARWLGFAKDRVHRKLYAIDQVRLRAAVPDVPRKGFLYFGRFAPEKRVDLIERAYARYRALGGTWTIDCYGQGGRFVQADEVPKVYAEHACLLLASSFDPWPLVMLEARSAGLEVIASDRCGNCDELGATKVPYGDVEAMARQMLSVEQGRRQPPCGDLEEYGCPAWVSRTLALAREVMGRNRQMR